MSISKKNSINVQEISLFLTYNILSLFAFKSTRVVIEEVRNIRLCCHTRETDRETQMIVRRAICLKSKIVFVNISFHGHIILIFIQNTIAECFYANNRQFVLC